MESFVVRRWVPDGTGAPALRGLVEHVASGRSTVFQASDGLLAFLSARVADAAANLEETDHE